MRLRLPMDLAPFSRQHRRVIRFAAALSRTGQAFAPTRLLLAITLLFALPPIPTHAAGPGSLPKVYQDHRPYALCAVAGSLAFLGLGALGLGSELASLAGIAVATGSRLLAIAFDWQLPSWRLPQK